MKIMQKVKLKINEYVRVLRVTKKPDSAEYKTILKIAAAGVFLIGFLGFLLQVGAEVISDTI
ncbi:MAG: protein translocase SEC61 complex subunit gamma [Nanoarchaeota archaeon]